MGRHVGISCRRGGCECAGARGSAARNERWASASARRRAWQGGCQNPFSTGLWSAARHLFVTEIGRRRESRPGGRPKERGGRGDVDRPNGVRARDFRIRSGRRSGDARGQAGRSLRAIGRGLARRGSGFPPARSRAELL
ncbi:hypothetical protein A33M_1529 [Rhodovulum sp. PH10]|nr:hypothetical protein A33M_1529 [Rhodovulum sp. PH10]